MATMIPGELLTDDGEHVLPASTPTTGDLKQFDDFGWLSHVLPGLLAVAEAVGRQRPVDQVVQHVAQLLGDLGR